MGTLILHTRALATRHFRELIRQPWGIAIALMQPIIWLFLFGSLFQDALTMPGIGIEDFRAWLTPGIVIMTAIFTSGWTGMGVIDDIQRGIMDRLLVTPVRRLAMISGRLVQQSVEVTVQSLLIILLGMALGFRPTLGAVVTILLAAVLLAWIIGAASIGFGLLAQERFALIGVNMLILPLMFLSSAFMHPDLMPSWINVVATFNPVNWGVEAARMPIAGDVGTSELLLRLGGLALMAMLAWWFAGRAFQSYQRSK